MIRSFKLDKLPEIISIYTVTRNTVWQIADTSHILIAILEGACFFKIGTQKYIVKKGDCVFIPKNTIYERSPYEAQKCKMLYIHFEVDGEIYELSEKDAYANIEKNQHEAELLLFNKNTAFSTSYTLYLKNHVSGSSELQQTIENIKKLPAVITLENSLKTVLNFCDLLFEISKETVKDFNIEKKSDIIKAPYNLKKAALYIQQNCHRKISVAELALHCNISQSQMTRYFKQTMHKTPLQYINDYKLNRAKHMLMNMPQLSVGAISESIGFDDQRYFSRLFFKTFKETPTMYRYRVNHYSEKKDDVKGLYP